MCGRFTLRRPGPEIAEHFDLEATPAGEPRYNIAPGQPVAVVRADAAGGRQLDELHWGLVPAWAEDARIGGRLVNARSETASERRAFAAAFRARRCIVPADGFYEWTGRAGARQAVHIEVRGGALFGIAGLWEAWRAPDGRELESCVLLTTDANAAIRPLHDRMPAILAPAAYADWLAPGEQAAEILAPLLRPLPGAEVSLRPVSPRVNHVAFDDPACLDPPPEPAQRELF
jgi:putative SOS response-associated peptidase YedK